MSDEQLERAIAVAKESALIEPDNAYWHWMEGILEFSMRRDDAALRALQNAGKCARFDDGIDATTRNRIALMKRVQVSDYDDEWFEAVAALFPHYARMRAAARETMWQANLAFKRGDTKRALEITEILQNASAPVARSRGFFIGRLVGQAMCYIAWRQTIAYSGGTPINFTEEQDPHKPRSRRAAVAQFADFAHKHGRADLAESAVQLQTTFNSPQITAALDDPKFDGLWQVNQPLARLHWMNAHLLRLALLSALVWMFTRLLSWRDNPLTTQSRRRLALGSAFCVGVTLAVLTACTFLGAVNQPDFFFDQTTSPSTFDFERNVNWLLAALWLVPPVMLALRVTMKRPKLEVQSRRVNGWALLAFGLVCATLASFYFVADALSQPIENTIVGQFWPWPLLVFSLLLLGTGAFFIRWSQPSQRLSTFLLVASAATYFATAIALRGNSTQQSEGSFAAAYWLPTFLAGGGTLLALMNGGFKVERFTEFGKQVLAGVRITAATLAVCTTVVYFLLIGVAAPYRYHAQKVLTAELREGESAYVEAHLQKQTPALQ